MIQSKEELSPRLSLSLFCALSQPRMHLDALRLTFRPPSIVGSGERPTDRNALSRLRKTRVFAVSRLCLRANYQLTAGTLTRRLYFVAVSKDGCILTVHIPMCNVERMISGTRFFENAVTYIYNI